jgi:hypothetical protein
MVVPRVLVKGSHFCALWANGNSLRFTYFTHYTYFIYLVLRNRYKLFIGDSSDKTLLIYMASLRVLSRKVNKFKASNPCSLSRVIKYL